jgi:hypothetical protein
MDRATSVTSTINGATARSTFAPAVDPHVKRFNELNEQSLKSFAELTRHTRRAIDRLRERDERILETCLDDVVSNNVYDSTSEVLAKNLRNGLLLPADKQRVEIYKEMRVKIEKKQQIKAAREKERLERVKLEKKLKRLSAS